MRPEVATEYGIAHVATDLADSLSASRRRNFVYAAQLRGAGEMSEPASMCRSKFRLRCLSDAWAVVDLRKSTG
jgi:hypothetical protein